MLVKSRKDEKKSIDGERSLRTTGGDEARAHARSTAS